MDTLERMQTRLIISVVWVRITVAEHPVTSGGGLRRLLPLLGGSVRASGTLDASRQFLGSQDGRAGGRRRQHPIVEEIVTSLEVHISRMQKPDAKFLPGLYRQRCSLHKTKAQHSVSPSTRSD